DVAQWGETCFQPTTLNCKASPSICISGFHFQQHFSLNDGQTRISSPSANISRVGLGFRFDIAHRIIRFQLLFAIKIPQASSSPSSSLTHSIPNSSARSIRVFVFQFVIRNSIPINSSEEQSMYRRREALVVHLACARCG
ncbi:hypothetical protein Drorol1_Dr00006709, partial [Drosera rotundifolia]